ncbi:MAG: CotH kinase family protein, partial [Erysipelotrichales bacterium]|nr:CotH kinase family protein [Erysipelotrichales bacterium]
LFVYRRYFFCFFCIPTLNSLEFNFNDGNSNSNAPTSVGSSDNSLNSGASTNNPGSVPNISTNPSSNVGSSSTPNDDDPPAKDDFRNINTHDEDREYACPASKADLTYHDLFDLHNKVNITINVSTKQLLKLRDDLNNYEKSDIYRIADSVKVEIISCSNTYTYEFDEVGIRLKGNTSRTSPVNSSGELVRPSHYKLSFTELFEDKSIYGSDARTYTEAERLERDERSLLGLEKLDLKWNRSNDKTHIKEIYSYEIYRANGILAPYASLAKVKMGKDNNSYDLGVYMIYETIDKKFIKRHLEEEQEYLNMQTWKAEKKGTNGVDDSKYGDLYKVSYGKGDGAGVPDMTKDSFSGKRIGEEANNGAYIPVFDRKSNKGTDNNVRLRNALNVLNDGNYSQIEKVVDLEYFARYEAISYLVGDPDDIRNNYNNYYVYIRRTDGKMIIIPQDHDRVFGICQDWNPTGDGMRSVKMYSDRAAGNGDKQRNPLYLKTLLASGTNQVKKDYENYCKALKISRWVTSEKFNGYFELAKKNYGNDYRTSSNGDLHQNQIEFTLKGNGNYSFEDYMKAKLNLIPIEEPGPDIPGEDYVLYLVGNFNGWIASSDYLFSKKTNSIYTLTVIANESFSGTIEFKINDGDWDREIDWGFNADFEVVDKGPNGVIHGIELGTSITFEIDVIARKLTYSIDGWTIEPLPDFDSYEYYFAYEANGWQNAYGMNEYRFEKTGNNLFMYTFVATQNYELLKFKVMCSNGVLFGTDDDQTAMIDYVFAQTFKEYNLMAGKKVVISLDTENLTLTWTVQ